VERVRNAELAAAIRQRDHAVAQVLAAEGLPASLMARYLDTRRELATLYNALSAVPLDIRPDGLWIEPVTLGELQRGDQTLADTIKACISSLATDAEHPLPAQPAANAPLARPSK